MEKELNLDKLEKKANFFAGGIFLLIITVSSTLGLLMKSELQSTLKPYEYIIIIIYVIFSYSFFLFLLAKCPYCNNSYFKAHPMLRSSMKKTIKESTGCVSCGKKAKIISQYLELL